MNHHYSPIHLAYKPKTRPISVTTKAYSNGFNGVTNGSIASINRGKKIEIPIRSITPINNCSKFKT